MSCKFIRWFKRQASLRKNSEKSDEKTQGSQNSSEEKKKTGFPRLSFRRRHKKRTGSAFEPKGALAIVGISKKFSFSVPKEMESHTTKESVKNGVPTSTSAGFGSVILTNSPSKSEGDKSTISELSYHSSFDYSRDASESPPAQENRKILMEESKAAENTPATSKTSNCDNHQTFHSVSSSINSIIKDRSTSFPSDDCNGDNIESVRSAAPIIKMEEICDNVSDKEHPEESQNDKREISVINLSKLEKDQNSSNGDENRDKVIENKQMEKMSVEKDEGEQMADTESDTDINTDVIIKEKGNSDNETNEVAIADSSSKVDNLTSDSKVYNVFNEIERLMKDTASLIEEEETLVKREADNKTDINEADNEQTCVPDTNEADVESLLSDLDVNGRLVSKTVSTCGDVPAITNGLECEKTNTEAENKMNNDEDATQQIDIKNSEKDIKASDNLPELQFCNTDNELSEDLKSEATISNDKFLPRHVSRRYEGSIANELLQPSLPHSSNTSLNKDTPKFTVNFYPKELNPFGDDDSDDGEPVENKLNETNTKCNKNVTVKLENDEYTNKENYLSSFEENTNVNRKFPTTSHHKDERFVKSRHQNTNNETLLRTSYKSLNPFGDSDEEGSSPLNEDKELQSTGTTFDIPPRLPPKTELRNRRKNSQGSLVPIPHPRKSKQSHHGSYTSLQNISAFPVPAPRSFTPSGSTRTLNESTNPFGDDDDDDGIALERRGLGRSSLQAGSSPCVPNPFSRAEASGSLPPALRIRGGKKKRQAPLPPGFPQNKAFLSPCDPKVFTSLSRKRSSTSPESDSGRFDLKPPTGRAVSPHGNTPPPRPPPPKSD